MDNDQDRLNTWFGVFKFNQKTVPEKFISTSYFALTILSQVGYGDMFPVS